MLLLSGRMKSSLYVLAFIYSFPNLPALLIIHKTSFSFSCLVFTQEPEKPQPPFHGVGRTLGGSSSNPTGTDPTVPATSFTTAPAPSLGLVVDETLPSTSIQLRLADGTRMVSRFNYHHTVRDIRNFIDASRSSGASDYQLQTVGFPPKQLTDPDQTIEQAGLASSVVIQKF